MEVFGQVQFRNVLIGGGVSDLGLEMIYSVLDSLDVTHLEVCDGMVEFLHELSQNLRI